MEGVDENKEDNTVAGEEETTFNNLEVNLYSN